MTADTIDSIDALLARYAAGNLPYPARVLVASHLEIKPDNRDFVRGLETLAGDALEREEPVAVSGGQRRLEAIFSAAREDEASPAPVPARTATGIFPAVLRDFVGFDADRVPWRTKLPGFREYDVGEIDGCDVTLFWIRPGRKVPTHTHEGSELSLVLDGAFSDVQGRYGRGDISVANESVEHRPIAERDRPCIGMAVTDAPLRLSGPLSRRLSDIIGI